MRYGDARRHRRKELRDQMAAARRNQVSLSAACKTARTEQRTV